MWVPHLVEDVLPGAHCPGVFREQREEIELLRSERERSTVEHDGARPAVDRQPRSCIGERAGSLPACGTSRHRAHPCNELAQPERLDHVVVRTELEPDDAIDLFAPCRHHDDRCVARVSQVATQIEAVDIWEPQVQQDHVGRAGQPEAAQRAGSGGYVRDLEPFPLETPDQRAGDRIVILDQQHPHQRGVGAKGVESLPPVCVGLRWRFGRHT